LDQQDIQKERRTQYRSNLGAVDHFIVELLAREISQTLATMNPQPGQARCLDVGCGRQPWRATLEKQGFAYHSIDLVQTPENSVDFIGAIDQPLPQSCLSEGPFDFVFCTEVLEHVFDWTAAFKNFHTLTAVGGNVLITCPFFYPLHEEPYDQWRATHYTVSRFATEAGFNIKSIQSAGDGWDVLGTAISAVGSSSSQPRLAGKVLRLLFRIIKMIILRASHSPFVRKELPIVSKFYMSNIVLLEKPR
jgi:SAM-dependent methyltransferase